ncbi:MAG: pyridoxal phosphate-dependent aminotransferase [Gammaproteobacteria bacterium]|nr:pyridoxal phosphate-dependent aminotransferase [Gammaproteobacteria bacterium]
MEGLRNVIATLPEQRIGAVAGLAINNPDVIPLWFGEPDLDTPEFIRDAAIKALGEGQTRYAHRRGIPALRSAIQKYLTDLYEIAPLDIERISCLGSGMTAIMVSCQMLLNNGDNIVMVSPTWPNIFYCAYTMGAEPRHVRLDPSETGWKLDLEKLFAACDERTRAIFINSPNNPTGWVMSREDQLEVLAFARKKGLWIIADEVYHRIVYSGRTVPSFLQISEPDERLLVVHSMSKAWCMTGWRCGWLVHPTGVGPQLNDLSGINNTGSATFVQHGAAAAINEGEDFVNHVVEHCRRGRDVVFQRLAANERVEFVRPDAAFYAFFKIHGVEDDLAAAQAMVREQKVGLAPGSAFGPGNEGYFRLCFAGDAERLSEAMDRFERYFA